MPDPKLFKLIGAAVRKERRALGLTQRQLGLHSGTGINFVSQVERGKASVRLDKLVALLQVVGLQTLVQRGRSVIGVDRELGP